MALKVKEYVLALPDNLLAALQGAHQSREKLGECKHSCGYVYMIGNCTQPNQRGKCPQCGGRIGGSAHVLDAGNVRFHPTIDKGTHSSFQLCAKRGDWKSNCNCLGGS